MDRIKSNVLICAYMEIFPFQAWEKDRQMEVWCMAKDILICNKDRQECINEFCELAKYDTSWEWLMPVVEKIRLDKWNTHQVYFIMHNDFVEVKAGSKKELGGMGFGFKVRGSGIDSVYEAVVKYLEL